MSHLNDTLNLSHSPYKTMTSLSQLDKNLKIGEFRLRYIKLMRDIQNSLEKDSAIDLIKELEGIWEEFKD